MDYFISMQPRSTVRFSALFFDQEEKSSFYPNDFPSMILQKYCVSMVEKFLVEKSQEDEPGKTNTESESHTIQDTTTSSNVTTITTTTSLPPTLPQSQQGSSDSILIQCIGELEQHMVDMHSIWYEIVTDAVDGAIQGSLRGSLLRTCQIERPLKEIFTPRMWESNSYQAHEDHKMLYEALEKSMARDHTDQLLTDLAEARRKKKKRHDSPKTPPGSPPYQPPPPLPPTSSSGTPGAFGAFGSSQLPPPPLSTNQSDQSKSTAAPSSSKTAASAEYTAWTTTDSRLKPSVYSSDDEDIRHDRILKVNLKQDWWKPLSGEDRPAIPEPAWSIPSSDLLLPTNNWASALASTYAPSPENSLLAQTGNMETFIDCKPLPLGGPQGQVTIQFDFFFNKDLEYLRYGSKGSRPALSISKIKAAYYPDVGLEQIVPDQMWIEEECKYNVAAMYGISHWWFQRQRLYIDRHTSEGNHRGVRTHMRILSVVIIEVFSLYGYDYMKKIVLRRADLQEHIIAERDFKYLYPIDFEDRYLLNLQGHLNHLPPKDKKILTTADKYGVQMIMRFNEIHKFSDGTLQQIDEALDYRVKEFKVNRMNPGLNTRFWSTKDVDRRKEFMFAIQKRLKTTRIFRNLESFVGG
ncbi:hypothetical protein Tco_1060675 [Tanacetum coccineum]